MSADNIPQQAQRSLLAHGRYMPQPLTRESLKRKHPELWAELEQTAFAQAFAEGKAGELARLRAIFEMAENFPGYDALARRVAFETRGTANDLAAQILAEEGKVRKAARAVAGAAQLTAEGDPQ